MNDGVVTVLREGAAAELKQAQFSLLRLRVVALDLDGIQDLVAQQVAAAPQLLTAAAVALDLDAVEASLTDPQLNDLVSRLRFCGLKPIAVACASDSPMAERAEAAGLPAIASYRRGRKTGREPLPAQSADAVAQIEIESAAEAFPAAAAPTPAPASVLRVNQPVRSGQQLYARGRDLVLTTSVSAGAEVIADGSVHIYGRLSGKALAGATGDEQAQIYCLAFDAELVSIAGRFRVFESVPPELKGKPCHLYLSGDRLEIHPLQ